MFTRVKRKRLWKGFLTLVEDQEATIQGSCRAPTCGSRAEPRRNSIREYEEVHRGTPGEPWAAGIPVSPERLSRKSHLPQREMEVLLLRNQRWTIWIYPLIPRSDGGNIAEIPYTE
jgi:hypothetical protein